MIISYPINANENLNGKPLHTSNLARIKKLDNSKRRQGNTGTSYTDGRNLK